MPSAPSRTRVPSRTLARCAPLLLALAACAGTGGGDKHTGGSDDPGDDDSGDDGGTSATRCTLSPAPDRDVTGLRVAPDGTVYLTDVTGTLYGYERDDDGEDCVLSGSLLWSPDPLQDVTDFALDAEGRVYLLVFYDALVRLASGDSPEMRCEVESGHGLAVTPDGSAVAVVPIGAESLTWTPIDGDVCGEPGAPIALPLSIGTSPAATADTLYVNTHDPTGTLEPVVALDPATGDLLDQLGGGFAPDGEQELYAVVDLVPTPSGLLVAGSPGGALWTLALDGEIERWIEADLLLPVAEEPTPSLGIHAIGWSATGPSYLAAGFLDVQGVWTLEL
jgi:hypothetical protein